jgi:hypothetical protein
VTSLSPRPRAGPPADTLAGRAPAEPAQRVRLPTSNQARLLLALCRRGAPHQPYAVVDGWAWYRWEDSEGGEGHLGLRTPEHPDHTDADELAERALAEVTTRQRAYVEVAAVLTRLVEFDGAERRWRLERVAELLYGPARRSSHRERQLPPLHGWLALLERGRWRLGDAEAPLRRRRRQRAAPAAPPSGARPLVTIHRATRSSATVRLDPALANSLASSLVDVPAETFRLPQRGHRNPHGNRPSLATRARVRVAAAVAPRRDVDLEQLLVDHAGVDLAPVSRRRRLATWFDVLTDDLAAIRRRFGIGLAAVPKRARHILDTGLRLVGADHDGPQGLAAATSQRLAARPPPP